MCSQWMKHTNIKNTGRQNSWEDISAVRSWPTRIARQKSQLTLSSYIKYFSSYQSWTVPSFATYVTAAASLVEESVIAYRLSFKECLDVNFYWWWGWRWYILYSRQSLYDLYLVHNGLQNFPSFFHFTSNHIITSILFTSYPRLPVT